MNLRECAQVKIVCIEALDWLARRPIDLRLGQLGFDCTDNTRRHLILQFEDVVERTVEAVGPDMRAGHCVD